MNTAYYTKLALLAPLIAFVLLAIIAPLRRRASLAGWLVAGAALCSLISGCTLVLDQLNNMGGAPIGHLKPWLTINGVPVAQLGWLIDGISAIMLVLVSLIALCTQIYSQAYYEGDSKKRVGGHYAWRALLLFSMNSMVVAPNLLQFIMAWQVVGVCSYVLISRDQQGAHSLKTVWMAKWADACLLFGLVVLYTTTKSFGWSVGGDLGPSGAAFNLAAGLLLIGAMGKSAQFPFHEWLPTAGGRSAPSAAILYSCTRCAAGIYLIVRAYPLFAASETILSLMCWMGAATACIAGYLALLQDDFKRMLAFSAGSQLGFAFAALGADTLPYGYLHLTIHALTSALLFFIAGAIERSTGSVRFEDVRGVGRSSGPLRGLYLAAALPLIGAPLTAGFFSRDQILIGLYDGGTIGPLLLCLVTTVLTAIYLTRAMLRIFHGTDASPKKSVAFFYLLPMTILGLAGLLWGLFSESFGQLAGAHEAASWNHLTGQFIGIPTFAFLLTLLGIGLGVALHRRDDQWRSTGVHAWLLDQPIQRFASRLTNEALTPMAKSAAWVDRYLIGAAIHFVAYVTLNLSDRAKMAEPNRLQNALWFIVLGVTVLALLGLMGNFNPESLPASGGQ